MLSVQRLATSSNGQPAGSQPASRRPDHRGPRDAPAGESHQRVEERLAERIIGGDPRLQHLHSIEQALVEDLSTITFDAEFFFERVGDDLTGGEEDGFCIAASRVARS